MAYNIVRKCEYVEKSQKRKCEYAGKQYYKKCEYVRGNMFKRKIYDKMLEWKENSDGKTALLIEGARRIGKSTVAEEFAKKEYESYILIDFAKASTDVRNLFEDVSDLDYLFLQLQISPILQLQL